MNSWARFYRGGRLAMALLLGVALISSTAWAAQTTKTLHDGNGSPFTIDVQTDGTNIWWIHSVCDPTTVTQCVAVNSAGQMTVLIGAGSVLGLTLGGNPISATNPMPTTPASTALTNSTATTVGTSAQVIVPYSATRKFLVISNRTTGNETQDIGSSNVTVGSGIPLAPGGGFEFQGPGAAGPIYGITTVTGSPISFVEG